ncbi:hypothetical protein [Buttiauxella sp. S19-1]|uniref:hypothetical protein n=1 Tax=Buttiauxella sp. S19-1 TaxID=941430 RepID=UPI001EDA7ECF|nr:hypothetical protein [Buttiauxella sp. S19-1]
MRVVVYQGQYGVFKKDELDLTMPAVQTCIGLYAISEQHDYILCAHFDTELRLLQNLQDIKQSLERKGISIMSLRATIFGGDGIQSYMRCTSPSTHIGNKIIHFLKTQGSFAEYSSQNYSGFVPKTFNFIYKRGCKITEGRNPRDFSGGSPLAEQLAIKRIRVRPEHYTFAQAKMEDVSRLYL